MQHIRTQKKDAQREILLSRLKRHTSFRSAVLMPAGHLAEVYEGLESGMYDMNTKFFFIESSSEVSAEIRERATDLGINFRILNHSLKAVKLHKELSGEYVDQIYLDTCGLANNDIVSWLIRTLLQSSTPVVDNSSSIAFTFALDARGMQLDYIPRLAEGRQPSIPIPSNLNLNPSLAIEHYGKASKIVTALYNMMPGAVERVDSFLYISNRMTMITVMFDVWYDAQIAASNLRYCRQILGSGIEKPNRLIQAKGTSQPRVTTVSPERMIIADIDPDVLRELVLSRGSLSEFGLSIGKAVAFVSGILHKKSTSLEGAKMIADELGVDYTEFTVGTRGWFDKSKRLSLNNLE